ncbi:MAG: hypothetical protein OXU54_04655 [Gammaproteobacteria bacterium]|nr:hypothetical protein [Gammaproteobacteria bacterium]
MTQANIELLEALESAGAPKERARAAATSVATAADMATKADLATLEARQEVARAAMETRLTRQHYGGLAVLLAAIAIATAVG